MALLQVDFKSNCLQRRTHINVILPVDHDAHENWPDHRGIPYKTLYLLHGIYGNSTSWLTSSNIMRYAEERNLAIVMPDGENSFYIDHPDYMNRHSEYVGRELVEMTRQMFPLSDKREDTWLGGFSMGGYGALRNGLKYSDTFGIVIGLSSACRLESLMGGGNGVTPSAYIRAMFGEGDVLHSDMNPLWIAQELVRAGKPLPQLYLSCGEQDFLYADNVKFVEELRKLNADLTWNPSEGRHDWEFWEKEIKYLVRDWLPTEAKVGIETIGR